MLEICRVESDGPDFDEDFAGGDLRNGHIVLNTAALAADGLAAADINDPGKDAPVGDKSFHVGRCNVGRETQNENGAYYTQKVYSNM